LYAVNAYNHRLWRAFGAAQPLARFARGAPSARVAHSIEVPSRSSNPNAIS